MNAFNEAWVSDHGKMRLRMPYQNFHKRTGHSPVDPSIDMAEQLMRRPFNDKLSVFPMPLILEDKEYREVVQPGIRQRARALQLFFADMVLGEQKIVSNMGPLDHSLTEQIFSAFESLNCWRSLWQGKSSDAIRFVYGPDLIRNAIGEWRVTEDNIGRIGATGDTYAAMQSFLRATGSTPRYSVQTQNDLCAGIQYFLDSLGLGPQDSSVVGLIAFDKAAEGLELRNRENTRRRQAMLDLGMEVWNILEITDQQRERIHRKEIKAIVNFDIRAWKPKREFFHEIFERQNIALLESPGVKSLSNKGFLPFVETMIEFYLRETPLLRTQPTRLVQNPKLPDDPDHWVIKECIGESGKEVYILKSMNDTQRAAVQVRLEEIFQAAEAAGEQRPLLLHQEYLEPSFLTQHPEENWLKFVVELRPITYVVGDDKIKVSESPAGRARSNLGDIRNNVNRGAMDLVVLREPTH